MRTLYVLFDAHCGLCTELSGWLREQPAYVQLQADLLCLDGSTGEVFLPAAWRTGCDQRCRSGMAWQQCVSGLPLGLRRYRTFARTLASPLLRPLARQAFSELSHNRGNISRLLGLRSEVEIQKHLAGVVTPPCELP
jgi:predicted DCC family thiol-disulfide oxidoreductase YuxK